MIEIQNESEDDDRDLELLLDDLRENNLALAKKINETNTALISWLGILSIVIILNIYTIFTFKKSWTILGLILSVPCIVKISIYKVRQNGMKDLVAKGETTSQEIIDYLSNKE